MTSTKNCKGKNNSVWDLIAAVRSFRQKLEIFKVDLQAMKRVHCERDNCSDVQTTTSFNDGFDDFSLGEQVLLFIQNISLVKNVTEFSHKAKLNLQLAR